MQVQGKTFLVTGGGNGIGREVVRQLLARGGRVAALDLREESLAETAALVGAGERLSLHPADVADPQAVADAVGSARAAHGELDGLINVAGIIQPFVHFVDLERSAVEKVMGVNFWGVVNTCQVMLPLLLDRPQACLVNVSSMGALAPVPGQTVYGASKAAVKLFTEGLYAETLGTSVAVSVVFPGAIETGITENSGVHMERPAAGGKTPTVTMTSAPDAAKQLIEEAVEQGRYRVLIGRDAKGLDAFTRVSPRRATEMIANKMKSLLG